MTSPSKTPNARTLLVASILATLLAGGLTCNHARAGELADLDASVRLIPEDAAFYGAMLRGREQIEAIGNSRAWAKIMEMPIVRMGLMTWQVQASDPDSVPGKIEAALKDPDTRKVIDTVADMFSNEVFIYGEHSCVEFLDLVQRVMGAVQFGALSMAASGQAGAINQDDMMAMIFFSTMAENLELVKFPDVVIGFKLTDAQRAAEQLEGLYALGTMTFEPNPLLKGRFRKTAIGGHEYLTLSLDGKMVPWEELPMEDLKRLPMEEGSVEKVIGRLKEMTLVVALGIRDDYLLLSIGNSTDCLAGLGRGKLLIDRAELKPLEPFARERLTSIGYVSKSLMTLLSTTAEDIDGLRDLAVQFLPMAPLPPDQIQRIRGDVADLATDLKMLIPEPGAAMSFSFLTDQGIESYAYDWGEHAELDGSKPLGLLQHLGGSPLLAVVGRSKTSTEGYDLLVKWLKVGYGYIEDFAVPQMPPEGRRQYEKAVVALLPLVKRADNATRTMLIPALADGQGALVIDAKLTSRQFVRVLPPTEEPMPMIEPAVVVGVSDAELLRKAFGEYRSALDGVVDFIREANPGAIPEDFAIPDPEVTEGPAGTIFGWALPAAWGVDEKIAPNLGLSETVGVMSASPDHTRRLLTPTPLASPGVLTDPDRPLAGAVLFDWAGLVDAAAPWVRFAAGKIMEKNRTDESEAAVIMDQVETVLEVLRVPRKYTSASYFEDGALVTHSLLEIRDVEEQSAGASIMP